ncbi:hypothetical protein K493DRAFT_28376, partial [Basidiobolus meristosporus CBS 931.73]
MELQRYNRLLLIFIHGFKGNERTFEDFPERLRTVLTNSLTAVDVDVVVYPQYETRGDLKAAATNLCNWIMKIGEERCEHGLPPPLIVLMGHSMGGLLAADAFFNLKEATAEAPEEEKKHIPKIIGILAYDTPYYGVEANLFAETARTRATDLHSKYGSAISLVSTLGAAVKTATTSTAVARVATDSVTAASSKMKWGTIGAVVAATAAAGATIYWQKENLQNGVSYVTEHLEFVKALTRKEELKERVKRLKEMSNEIIFHCYYMQIQGKSGYVRTFIIPPPEETAEFFTPVKSAAPDEVDAHTTMFNPGINHQYYQLGDASIKLITVMVRNNM